MARFVACVELGSTGDASRNINFHHRARIGRPFRLLTALIMFAAVPQASRVLGADAPQPSCDKANPKCTQINGAITTLGDVLKSPPPTLHSDEAALVRWLIGQLATAGYDFPNENAVALASALQAALAKVTATAADAKFSNAMTTLRTALAKFDLIGPRINVVDAWFGDLRDINRARMAAGASDLRRPVSGSRWCLASEAVRAFCQARTICAGPAVDSTAKGTTTFAPESLCGYDPVPFADARVKGLVVQYECLKKTQPEWDALEAAGPGTREADDDQQNWAVLRVQSAATIRCQAQTN
ncbi:MAG: hypothetical protein ACLPKB_30575 [Xanthobacteraceae bacterium]